MGLIDAIPISSIGMSRGVKRERHSRLAKRFGGGSFADMVAAKGDKEIGDKVNLTIDRPPSSRNDARTSHQKNPISLRKKVK